MDKWNLDSNKLLWHMDRIKRHYDKGERIAPIHIDMAITKRCNAKCIYCYGIHQKMQNIDIPEETLLKMMMDAANIGVKSITFTGDGENTLNPALYPALEMGYGLGIDFGLATNGIELNENKIKTLIDTCTWLRFNLSGVGMEGYKSIHGVSQWERVQANISNSVALRNRYESDCTIGLQMVLTPDCLQYVLNEADFAVENGLDYFVIKQYSDPGCKGMSPFNLRWYENQGVWNTLNEAESRSNDRTQIISKKQRIMSQGSKDYDHCVDAPLLFQVSGNGKCYPCGFLFNNEDYCYGDLNKDSLETILNSEHYWNLIEKMKNEFDVHKDCEGCCRHDSTNQFMWEYLHPPGHINFI